MKTEASARIEKKYQEQLKILEAESPKYLTIGQRLRIEARMQEFLWDKDAIEKEARQSFKSNPVGNSVDMFPENGVGLPAEAGTQSVAGTSRTNVKKKFENGGSLLERVSSFFFDMIQREEEGSNFIKDFVSALGREDHGQRSEYISFIVGDEKMRLRLSDHSGNARNIVKKGARADKGVSVVLNIEKSNNRDFEGNSWANVEEYVYDNPTQEQLEGITCGLFNLFDKGEYIDLASANKHNVSPTPDIRFAIGRKGETPTPGSLDEERSGELASEDLANASLNSLGIGHDGAAANNAQTEAAFGELMYDKGKTGPEWVTDEAQEAYEKAMRGVGYKTQEAHQDSMLALKKVQEILGKTSGKSIKDQSGKLMPIWCKRCPALP